MSLIGLLVFILIAGLIFYLISIIPMDPKFKTAATIVFIIILIIFLLNSLGGLGSPVIRLR